MRDLLQNHNNRFDIINLLLVYPKHFVQINENKDINAFQRFLAEEVTSRCKSHVFSMNEVTNYL